MLRSLEIVPSTDSWSELLEWVNSSMPVEAPNHHKAPTMRKVEDCGHGVPYVLMLPSMLPIIHTPLLTSRVKVPAKTDYEAVANLKIMQDALRRNGIVIPDVLANASQKLVSRNFQANLQLLQWFRGLYVSLQQCGIEAGEGRIILEASNAEDDISSLGSPPSSVVRAEDRRRAESVRPAKPDSEVLREVRAAGSQGDAAAAAAAALLGERRSQSHNRSQSRASAFESARFNSSYSGSYAVHHQQVPEVLPPPSAPRQPRYESASRSRREGQAPANAVEAKATGSSPAAPSLVEARGTPTAPAAPAAPAASAPASVSPRPGVKQVTKASAPPSKPRKVVERPSTPTEHHDPCPVPPEAAAATPAVPRASTPTAKAATSGAAPRRASPVPRRPSAAGTPTAASANRTPRPTDTPAPSTRARTPVTGRSALIFKPIPARLSGTASAPRRPSVKGSVGSTPRGGTAASSTPQSAAGSRRASTPKATAAAERGGASPVSGGAAARQPASRRPKTSAKPIIALNSTSPAPPPVTPTSTPAEAEVSAPASAPAPAPADATAADAGAATEKGVPATSSGTPAAGGDVVQLQIDRQFYYDKLRAIEELVDCMEAKKKQEQKAAANGWHPKDEEMLDFTQAVRSVLYADS